MPLAFSIVLAKVLIFSKEVYEFLAKVVILVRRSDIFEKKY